MSHSHHHHHKVSGKNLLITVILNIIITIAQVIGGILSGSLALLSDALHNLVMLYLCLSLMVQIDSHPKRVTVRRLLVIIEQKLLRHFLTLQFL